jgi:hypothetical protein
MNRKKAAPAKVGRRRVVRDDATPAERRAVKDFADALAERGVNPEVFGEITGAGRATVFTWLAAKYPLPPWAMLVLELPKTRLRELAEKAREAIRRRKAERAAATNGEREPDRP